MRPVNRGPWPTDDNGGEVKFSEYSKARGFLIDRIGDYCSYCEIPIPSSPDVEHVKPKKHHPNLETNWDNFLLGCRNCNSIKSSKNVDIPDYFWPDDDNTYIAFEYTEGGVIKPNGTLTDGDLDRSRRTIGLTGLDRRPGHQYFSKKDRRWIKREEAWGKAQIAKGRLQVFDNDIHRDSIIDIATSSGFWSIWMTVFHDDEDMLDRLINAFPGTCAECFDNDGKPIPRPGGAI